MSDVDEAIQLASDRLVDAALRGDQAGVNAGWADLACIAEARAIVAEVAAQEPAP